MRTPLAAADFSGCSRLPQHTLIFAGGADVAEGARRLSGAMARATYVEGEEQRGEAAMYTEELAQHMLAHFEAHKFRGHMEGLGHNPKLPLLTKLAGGLKSFQVQPDAPLAQ